MTISQLTVTVAGLGTVTLIVWFFWLQQAVGAHAAINASGSQEQLVLVKGRYDPDTIVAKAGQPLRLVFRREESAACSEIVVFDAFGKSAHLPEGEEVAIELTPEKPGEYPVSCAMGMLRGRLVIEP